MDLLEDPDSGRPGARDRLHLGDHVPDAFEQVLDRDGVEDSIDGSAQGVLQRLDEVLGLEAVEAG